MKQEGKPHSRFGRARKWLIFWTLFIGLGAVGGAAMMLLAPSGRSAGMDGLLPYFQVLPFADVLFQDLTFSGFALLLVNGLMNLTAAGLLLARKPLGVTLGGVFGVTLMLWICIQFVILPANVMSAAYFLFGLAQAATGYAGRVFAKQEAFCVRAEDYPNVGTDPKRLVVYFSRMGYGERLALEEVNRTGRRSVSSALRSGRKEHPASGGAGDMGCTAGRCRSSRSSRPARTSQSMSM